MGAGRSHGSAKKRIGDSDRLRDELALAARLQIAPRRLWGWEPRESTEYVYEGDRLIRSVTTREPEWNEEQIDLLLAAAAFKADVGPHGQLMSEATSDDANPNNYDSPLRFVGKGPFVDWAEKAKADREAEYKAAAGKDANLNGMYFVVEKLGS